MDANKYLEALEAMQSAGAELQEMAAMAEAIDTRLRLLQDAANEAQDLEAFAAYVLAARMVSLLLTELDELREDYGLATCFMCGRTSAQTQITDLDGADSICDECHAKRKSAGGGS